MQSVIIENLQIYDSTYLPMEKSFRYFCCLRGYTFRQHKIFAMYLDLKKVSY